MGTADRYSDVVPKCLGNAVFHFRPPFDRAHSALGRLADVRFPVDAPCSDVFAKFRIQPIHDVNIR